MIFCLAAASWALTMVGVVSDAQMRMADKIETQYFFLFLCIPLSLLVGNYLNPSESDDDFPERDAILSCGPRELIVFIKRAAPTGQNKLKPAHKSAEPMECGCLEPLW